MSARCSAGLDHEATKRNAAAWSALRFCGVQVVPPRPEREDGYELELRTCACGSTLGRRRIPAAAQLAACARVCIAGGPRAGKSTLAAALHDAPLRGDDVRDLGWSESSEEVSHWLDAIGAGPWVLEGRLVARALRKWLDRADARGDLDAKPCDLIVVLDRPFVALTRDQARERKGCATVFCEIATRLRRRGVRILGEEAHVIDPARMGAADGGARW